MLKTIIVFTCLFINSVYAIEINSNNELINYSSQAKLLQEKINTYQLFLSNNPDNILIPQKIHLHINESSIYIPIIKQKLFLSGEYKNNFNYSSQSFFNNIFTLELSTALFNYQLNNNLTPTGELNEQTIKKINIPNNVILNNLIFNYDRIKNLNFESNYIVVNLPFYSLNIIQDNNNIFEMGVIVGSNKHQSCILNSEIKQIVINPSWYVPNSITNKEYLHKLSNDPEYFDKRNFKIFENGEEIDPLNYSGDYENIKLVQLPSKNNALGQIKFVFDNSCGIYLHDTNQRELFSTDKKQNLSHGCIRLSKPFILADFLFRHNNLDTNNINIALENEKTKIFNLKSPYKIHIIYQNYVINNSNEIVVKKDIYNKNI